MKRSSPKMNELGIHLNTPHPAKSLYMDLERMQELGSFARVCDLQRPMQSPKHTKIQRHARSGRNSVSYKVWTQVIPIICRRYRIAYVQKQHQETKDAGEGLSSGEIVSFIGTHHSQRRDEACNYPTCRRNDRILIPALRTRHCTRQQAEHQEGPHLCVWESEQDDCDQTQTALSCGTSRSPNIS